MSLYQSIRFSNVFRIKSRVLNIWKNSASAEDRSALSVVATTLDARGSINEVVNDLFSRFSAGICNFLLDHLPTP